MLFWYIINYRLMPFSVLYLQNLFRVDNYGGNINMKDPESETLIYAYTKQNIPQVIQLLTSLGATVYNSFVVQVYELDI